MEHIRTTKVAGGSDGAEAGGEESSAGLTRAADLRGLAGPPWEERGRLGRGRGRPGAREDGLACQPRAWGCDGLGRVRFSP